MAFCFINYARIRVFADPYFPVLRTKSLIPSLYEKMRVRENPYSGIFYVLYWNILCIFFTNMFLTEQPIRIIFVLPHQKYFLSNILKEIGTDSDLGRFCNRGYFRSIWNVVYRCWAHGIWAPKFKAMKNKGKL